VRACLGQRLPLFPPFTARFPGSITVFQALLFVFSHGSRNQSIIEFRKLYVTKSDFLIDVDMLHCVYNNHKFLYPSSCF
jgi:hypothetical protein